MDMSDYDAVLDLWRVSGFTIRPLTDTREGIERLLVRNPGLSIVALDGELLVGCALGSHDGRRGFLQHVAVSPASRGLGIATKIVDICLERFRALNLGWVHLDVVEGNDVAMSFWQRIGWGPRDELTRLSFCLLD
jgi:ribosomal protein S18 acetylase RimI-like enzyme